MVKTGYHSTSSSHSSLYLVVEGVGQKHDLSAQCRKAFTYLLDSYGLLHKPRIVWGGGRNQAYDKFKTLVETGKKAILLVDSEAPIPPGTTPWNYFKSSAGNLKWLEPSLENDDDCHFMVQCMENWILSSDPPICVGAKNIPLKTTSAERNSPENISKDHALALLDKAFKEAGKREYKKGRDSFPLLEKVNPLRLYSVARWAKRFFDALSRRSK